MSKRRLILASVLAAATLATATRPDRARAGLIGWWRFDGCTATDASGNGRDLSAMGGPACVAGEFGDAWSLDGTSQYLDRGADAAFTPGSRPWSVALWVKTASAPGVRVALGWYRCGANPSCTTGDGALYSVGLDQQFPYWEVRDDGGHDITVHDSESDLADGQWHFIVGTLNSARDTLKLYVDGALRARHNGPLGALSSGAIPVPLEVGRWYRTGWGSPDGYFPGAIDEVRIYDEELSAVTVAALYGHNAVGVPDRNPTAQALAISAPNPARTSALRVRFTLPGSEPAVLTLHDIAGRRVASQSLGAPGPGRHEVELLHDATLAPGIYLIRLAQGAQVATRRVALLE